MQAVGAMTDKRTATAGDKPKTSSGSAMLGHAAFHRRQP